MEETLTGSAKPHSCDKKGCAYCIYISERRLQQTNKTWQERVKFLNNLTKSNK